MAESFFAALKNELVHRTVYPTRKQAYQDIAQWIELWYNRKRRHSGLAYRTPREVHNEFLNKPQAA
jgi:putative transposase